jgi:putative PEP-CTERM system histidine kinase
MGWFAVGSYLCAAIAFGSVGTMLVVSHPGGRAATALAAATLLTSIWAGGIVFQLLGDRPAAETIVMLDVLHVLAWVGCVHACLGPAADRSRLPVRTALALAAGLLGVWAVVAESSLAGGTPFAKSALVALLGSSLVGLLMVEQLYRNARDDQRASLSFLSAAIGGIFVVDLVAFAQATLLSGVMPSIWLARGLANALIAPLLLIAIKRQREWQRELFVSRHVVFYTASLVGVGAYLMVMGIIAYVIRAAGGEWGVLLQSLFLLLALIVLVVTLFSAGIRARTKVFLVKHFYRNKYDYRDEWLRLTGSLGRSGGLRELVASGLHGIARIVSSPAGALWLTTDEQRYERMDVLGTAEIGEPSYDRNHAMLTFLAAKGWVIDSDEYAREPDLYGNAFGPPIDRVLPPSSICVPLDCQGKLQGFVVLRAQANARLNFEDHDILKTAGRQVAVVLAQALAQERLAETRQFEALNKLATFLMHDLKNLIAQQELVVANAQRFRHRPEFIDDAIATVRSGVERMKKVMEQLQRAGHKDASRSRVDVAKVLLEVRSQCADRAPVPTVNVPDGGFWVTMGRDDLASVVTHLIRNAQDATPPEGSIDVEVVNDGRKVVITVVDSGRGMTPEFIRDRLFRPFDTTKGVQGMGIGAYQVRDVVRSAGGDVEVQSEVGVGTRFRISLPATDDMPVRRPAA